MRLDSQTELNNLINTDHLYRIEIPTYKKQGDVVLYHFLLADFTHNTLYECDFRYSELKNVHKQLAESKSTVAEFPQSHFWTFWKRTNQDRQLIEQRRYELEYYFNVTLNNPLSRGYPSVKHFIQLCKERSCTQARRHSDPSSLITVPAHLKRRTSQR